MPLSVPRRWLFREGAALQHQHRAPPRFIQPQDQALQRQLGLPRLGQDLHPPEIGGKAAVLGPEGADAREYLKGRGLQPETLARFGFGFAPDSRDGLKKAMGDLKRSSVVPPRPFS